MSKKEQTVAKYHNFYCDYQQRIVTDPTIEDHIICKEYHVSSNLITTGITFGWFRRGKDAKGNKITICKLTEPVTKKMTESVIDYLNARVKITKGMRTDPHLHGSDPVKIPIPPLPEQGKIQFIPNSVNWKTVSDDELIAEVRSRGFEGDLIKRYKG